MQIHNPPGAPLDSPALTGVPLAPTAAPGTNTTQIATTAFAKTADDLKANINSPTLTGTPAAPTAAPATGGTQLATCGYADASSTAAAGAAVSGLAPLANPTFTGVPAAPTAAPGTNTTQIATTAFVLANAPAGGLTRIGQVVAAGDSGTMSVGSIPGTYSALLIHFQGRGDSATNNQSAYCRLNGDSGANYSCEMTGGSGTSSSTSQSTGAASLIDMAVPAATSTALRTGTIQTTIIGYANAFSKVATSSISAYNYETFQAWLAHSVWASASAVTSVTFGVNAGNWVAGSTLTVYGMA